MRYVLVRLWLRNRLTKIINMALELINVECLIRDSCGELGIT
jgi:hypothetical protein